MSDQCPECDGDLVEVKIGGILRWGDDEIRKGDHYKCIKCDESIWINLSEPYRSQLKCSICSQLFSSVSLYYKHLDDVENHDRCRECHDRLVYDNYFGHYEGRPYGDTDVGEFIVTGYRCLCGNLEEW